MLRVLFSPQLNDYINASFMDGYKQRNAYIGTQGTALNPCGSHQQGYFAPDAGVGFTSLPSISPWLWSAIVWEEGGAWQVPLLSGCIYSPLSPQPAGSRASPGRRQEFHPLTTMAAPSSCP